MYTSNLCLNSIFLFSYRIREKLISHKDSQILLIVVY